MRSRYRILVDNKNKQGPSGPAGTDGETPTRHRKVLTTDSSGVYTGPLGGPLMFLNEPAILITPQMASGNFDWRYTISGSSAAGYTITVSFTRRATVISGDLAALLAGISTNMSPVTVTFSLVAVEQS